MTGQADFKRRIRARMGGTGESYSVAQQRLLAQRAAPEHSTPEQSRGEARGLTTALHVTNGDCTDLRKTGLAQRRLV